MSVFQNEYLLTTQHNRSSFEEIDKRMSVQKGELDDFERLVDKVNSSLSLKIAKFERHFADKHQTKKAFEFLDKKLNKFISEDKASRRKLKFGGTDDPCLRINRCESSKKIEGLSDKSIMEKL